MRKRKSLLMVAGILLTLILITNPILALDRPAIPGTRGMVTANNPLTAQVGFDILNQGGNAIDALVAMAKVNGVVEPWISGPGGAGFAMVYIAETDEVHYLEFSGVSPAALTLDHFPDGIPYRCPQGLTALIPGTVMGWEVLRAEFGTMSRQELYQPSIDFAKNGYPAYARMASNLNFRYRPGDWFDDYGGLGHRTWLAWPRDPVETGSMIYNPNMAETYRRIAEEGVEVFYGGEVGEMMVEFMQEIGGVWTIEDLANYQANWMEPVHTTYRGYDIYAAPPNCSGGIALAQIMNIVELYDIEAMGVNSADYIHVFIEAIKLAVADRDEWIADPDWLDIPIDELTCKDYAKEQNERISMEEAMPYPDPGMWRDDGTTNFTVVDKDGNMASIVQSNGGGWGSHIILGDTGVHINNGIAWMEDDPDNVNVVEGGKRSRWNMTPVMVFDDGKPVIVTGGLGGTQIWQNIPQVLVKVLDFGMDMQQAISSPRLTYQMGAGEGFLVRVEDRVSSDVIEELENRGHIIFHAAGGVAHINGVYIHPVTNALIGGSEPRIGGHVMGW